MALILLIRHTVTEATGHRLSGTTPGIHLSERGREQATHLAERLRGVPLAAVYASPLERCVETAGKIAAARGLDVVATPEVQEVDYGRWTGRSMRQVVRTRLWRQLQDSPGSITFPGGESLVDVQRRSVRAVEGVAARYPKRVVAVVTHADVIRLVLAHFAGIHIDLYQRLIVSPGSITAVLLGDRIPRILRVNDTGAIADVISRLHPPAGRPTAAAAPPPPATDRAAAPAPRMKTC